MAGCLCPDSSGNISPETFRRYVDSLENVLSSQLGQQRFREFLSTRDIDEGVATLDFWIRCNELINNPPQNSIELRRQARGLVTFANEEDINFDVGELRAFSNFVDSRNRERILEGVSLAKQTAFRLLNDYYNTFCAYLLKQKGYVKDKK